MNLLPAIVLWVGCTAQSAPPSTTALPFVMALTQSMFADGPVFLTTPGLYTLETDIVFNPNARENGGNNMPRPAQFKSQGGVLDDSAFGIGFFAAIVITGPNIVLDLQGHALSQHAEHRLQQRFFTLISLASAPFIKVIGVAVSRRTHLSLQNQGPSDFASTDLATATAVVITNGVLGASSHHGIHGNGPQTVVLRNLVIRDWEVAAVHLNGARDVTVENVVAGPIATDVFINGRFSASRFMLPYVQFLATQSSCADAGLVIAGQNRTPAAIFGDLQMALEQTYQAILHNVGTVHPLYANPSGLGDGSAYYGLVFNKLGVAVNGLAAAPPTPIVNNLRVALRNVTIRDVVAAVAEVVALAMPSGAPQLDAVGAAFDFLAAMDESGNFVGNPLANAQLLVHKYKTCFPSKGFSTRRSTLQPWALSWAGTRGPLAVSSSNFVCSGDIMSHTNKGIIGLRVDAGQFFSATNVTISNMVNKGRQASARCGQYVRSLPLATMPGYNGAHAVGVSLAASLNVTLAGLRVTDVLSMAGHAFGIRVNMFSAGVLANAVTIRNVTTLSGAPFNADYVQLPQERPLAQHVFIDDSTVTNCVVTEPMAPQTTMPPNAATSSQTRPPATTAAGAAHGSKSALGAGLAVVWVAIAVMGVVFVVLIAVVARRHRDHVVARDKAKSPAQFANPLFLEAPMGVAARVAPARSFANFSPEYIDSASDDDDDGVTATPPVKTQSGVRYPPAASSPMKAGKHAWAGSDA